MILKHVLVTTLLMCVYIYTFHPCLKWIQYFKLTVINFSSIKFYFFYRIHEKFVFSQEKIYIVNKIKIFNLHPEKKKCKSRKQKCIVI